MEPIKQYAQPNLILRHIHPNPTTTTTLTTMMNQRPVWTLAQADEITTPELADKYGSVPRGVYVTASEVDHVPKMQSFGFVIEEPKTLPRSLDVLKAAKLGISDRSLFRIIKSGFPVESGIKLSCGNPNIIQPDDVLIGPRRQPRKITLLGDCCYVPDTMIELSSQSDVLIHEATFSLSDTGRRVEYGGHSSAHQAGVVANRIQAKVLLLNHLNPHSNYPHVQQELIQEATNAIQGRQHNTNKQVAAATTTSESTVATTTTTTTTTTAGITTTTIPPPKPPLVQLSYDHLEILVPRGGFQF
jgi:hypothetical protein